MFSVQRERVSPLGVRSALPLDVPELLALRPLRELPRLLVQDFLHVASMLFFAAIEHDSAAQ
jgi:hypothetical protein